MEKVKISEKSPKKGKNKYFSLMLMTCEEVEDLKRPVGRQEADMQKCRT